MTGNFACPNLRHGRRLNRLDGAGVAAVHDRRQLVGRLVLIWPHALDIGMAHGLHHGNLGVPLVEITSVDAELVQRFPR